MPVHTLNRTLTQAAISAASGANRDLVAAATGLRIYVVQIVFTLSADGTVQFTEGAGPTTLAGAMNFLTANGAVVIGDGNVPVIATQTPGAKFGVTLGLGNMNGWLSYYRDV